MKIQKSVIELVAKLIHDKAFQARHKRHSQDFTRNRKLTFSSMAAILLRMVKQSLQINCNWFGDQIDTEPVSKQAFSQARQKLSPECFQELFHEALRENYSLTGKRGLWKNYRLIACDGSTVRLPESQELAQVYGRWPKENGAPPLARISEFTDMTSKLVLIHRTD